MQKCPQMRHPKIPQNSSKIHPGTLKGPPECPPRECLRVFLVHLLNTSVVYHKYECPHQGLSSSPYVKEIPDSIGRLINLKELDISSIDDNPKCNPSLLRDMACLEKLTIDRELALQQVPESITNLLNLKYLELHTGLGDEMKIEFVESPLINFISNCEETKSQ